MTKSRQNYDVELRNRQPRLRSGWDDADVVETLRMIFLLTDLLLTEILSKTSFVVY